MSGLGGYYATAEPVGVCSCHECTCDGCRDCETPEDMPAGPDYPPDERGPE